MEIPAHLAFLRDCLRVAREMHTEELGRVDRSGLALKTLFSLHSEMFEEALGLYLNMERHENPKPSPRRRKRQ